TCARPSSRSTTRILPSLCARKSLSKAPNFTHERSASMPAPADRLSKLPAYVFAVVGDRLRDMQAAGIDVIRLDIGSPDAPPPSEVVDKLYEAAKKPGNHGYSGYRGLGLFREAVARYYQRRFNVTLDPNTEILPLLGSKEGIVNLCLAYCDEGDAALIPNIGYPSYMQ